MRIYTRTGDDGSTGLFGGRRVGKDDLRIEVLGSLDELNCVLGVARSHGPSRAVDTILDRIQSDLLDIGAQLASAGPERIRSDHVVCLEGLIDESTARLPPLSAFIVPGGCAAGAALHHARTVCRRCERRLVALSREEGIAAPVLQFVNRLSDLLFVLARLANQRARRPERVWSPATGAKAVLPPGRRAAPHEDEDPR